MKVWTNEAFKHGLDDDNIFYEDMIMSYLKSFATKMADAHTCYYIALGNTIGVKMFLFGWQYN